MKSIKFDPEADKVPRWLIDTDKDEEGMRIIADLHGDNLDNIEAKAEFREIKDKVVFEVRVVRGGCPVGGTVLRRRGRRARTRRPCVWRKGRVAFGRSDAYAPGRRGERLASDGRLLRRGAQAACEDFPDFAVSAGVPQGLQASVEVVQHMLTTCISSARLVRAGRTA